MKKIVLIFITLLLVSCQDAQLSIIEDESMLDLLTTLKSEDIHFEFGTVPFETIEEQLSLSNVESTFIEKNLEQITFELTYETEDAIGVGKVKLEVDSEGSDYIFKNLEQEAIILTLKDVDSLKLDPIQFEKYLSSNASDGFEFELNQLKLAFTSKNIDSILHDDYYFKDLNTLIQPVTINASTTTYTLNGSFDLTYNPSNKALLNVEMVSDESTLVLKDDIIGRWTGQFIYNSEDMLFKESRYITILNILEPTDDNTGFKGYITLSQVQFIHMDARDDLNDKKPVASYEFVLTPDLEENKYSMTTGDWIKDPNGRLIPHFQNQLEYSFTLIDEDTLYGSPIHWTNTLLNYVEFDQNHDPFDND